MPLFRVQGKSVESGNPRRRQYRAKSEPEAQAKAEADGILVSSIEELSPLPPSESQIAYASGLGIAIPNGITKDEISDLIAVKTSGDKPSSFRQRRFAEAFGLEPAQYIGKKHLFDAIWIALKEEERQFEMVQWFVFRVYRQLVNGSLDAPIDSPFDDLIVEVARCLVGNEKAVASVSRYEGAKLIWFGEGTTPDGFAFTGGSDRTIAYKEASRLLQIRLGNYESAKSSEVTRQQKKPPGMSKQAEADGCAGIVLAAFFLPAGLVAYLIHYSFGS
jgi:hypothetical protein